jgi:hypothetical protein
MRILALAGLALLVSPAAYGQSTACGWQMGQWVCTQQQPMRLNTFDPMQSLQAFQAGQAARAAQQLQAQLQAQAEAQAREQYALQEANRRALEIAAQEGRASHNCETLKPSASDAINMDGDALTYAWRRYLSCISP